MPLMSVHAPHADGRSLWMPLMACWWSKSMNAPHGMLTVEVYECITACWWPTYIGVHSIQFNRGLQIKYLTRYFPQHILEENRRELENSLQEQRVADMRNACERLKQELETLKEQKPEGWLARADRIEVSMCNYLRSTRSIIPAFCLNYARSAIWFGLITDTES
jgi:hypothetical protein